MLEKEIEKTFCRKVKAMGGRALKFISPGMSGVPDRIVLLSDARIAFVELKAPGEKLRHIQMRRKKQIEALGFKVYVIDDPEKIDEVLDEIQSS